MDLRQAFFDNLLMLDFNPHDMSSRYYVTFNKDMFAMPNHKAFQFVTYFLFQRLDKTAADEAFRHCWPISDKKAEAEFRKICCNWLSELSTISEHDDLTPPLPRIVPSLFMSPGGEKFYYLMFCFSRLVLVRVSARDLNLKPHQLMKTPNFADLPKDSPISLGAFVTLSQSGVIAERSQFVQELQLLHAEQAKWAEAADRFINSYRSALRCDKGSDEKLKGELESAASDGARLAGIGPWSRRFHSGHGLNLGTPGSSAAGGRMAQKAVAERVRRFWRRIEEIWSTGSTVIQLLSDCLADRGGETGESLWRIEGSQIKIRLPDLLVHRLEEMALSASQLQDEDEDEEEEDFSRVMSKIQPVDLYDRGRLNLIAVVRFATVALNFYSDQLGAIVGPGGDYSSVTDSLISQLPSDSRYLKQMISQLKEIKKGATQIHDNLHKRVHRMLDDTVYRLPATISSLSASSSDTQNLSENYFDAKPSNNSNKQLLNDDGLSPSFFAATKANTLHDATATPANVLSRAPGAKKAHQPAAATAGLLDLSGGEQELDLVPMTPLVSAASSIAAQKRRQPVHVEAYDENNDDAGELLIDLGHFSR